MYTRVQVGDTAVDVVRKDIKNVHLSVHPPTGRVRIAAPLRMNLDTIRVFAVSKLPWIRRQQGVMRSQERETPREYLDRESHYIWGRRCLLAIRETPATPSVELGVGRMTLRIRPGASMETRGKILEKWYRDQLRAAFPPMIAKWERQMGVTVRQVVVRRMKTRWGGCNPRTGLIRLNTDLTKKPAQCLEYVIVHEMVHLLEPSHNMRFLALMDEFMPQWRSHRDLLNRLPLRHESWAY